MKKLNFSRICLLLVSILLFQGSTIYFSRNIPNSEAIVFHKTGESIIAMKSKRTLKIYSETSSENSFLKDYSRERKIENFSKHKSQNIIDFSDKMILFIDTTKNYNLNNFQPEIIILSNSPKINLERILDDLSPKQIVVDGSNYYSLVDRWKETAYNKKIPFHYTREKGAYIINSYEED